MRGPVKRVAIALAALLLMASGSVASASPERVTYGDVRANFEGIDGGGAVIRAKKGYATTIPPAQGLRYSVKPRPEAVFDGRHYCELDWLVVDAVLLGDMELTGTDSVPELRASFATSRVTLVLDNVPLQNTETTAVKREPEPSGIFEGIAFWRAWGVFYAPGQLATGAHTLAALVDGPDAPFYTDQGPITFHIDAAGSGACL